MTEFAERGTRLMASLTAQDPTLVEPDNPMRELALSACATADRVAVLEDLARTVEPFVETKAGMATHPVFVEVRSQATLLSRLIVSLRLPDPRTGKRPQHRSLRGVHQPSQVSSLERARRRSEERA